MLKKTITYTDYNGLNRTEDFYFNLNKSELMKLELGTTGGLAESIRRIVAANDTPSIIAVFEDLIQKSYGVKSADGRSFVKNEKVLNDFIQTEAYSMLFMELATDDKAAAAFVNGIIPADMDQKSVAPMIAPNAM